MIRSTNIVNGILVEVEVTGSGSARVQLLDTETDEEEVINCKPQQAAAFVALLISYDDTGDELQAALEAKADVVISSVPVNLDPFN